MTADITQHTSIPDSREVPPIDWRTEEIIAIAPGFIEGAFKYTRAAGGLCIVDEVQSGFDRTGDSMWCFDTHNVVPDILVVASGIGNAIPPGAVVTKREVAQAMEGKFIFHPYGANPAACAAVWAALRIV